MCLNLDFVSVELNYMSSAEKNMVTRIPDKENYIQLLIFFLQHDLPLPARQKNEKLLTIIKFFSSVLEISFNKN